jgi:hypothetical protein
MLRASLVSDKKQLQDIHDLNLANLRQNLDADTRNREGFVTWLYPIELLEKMHALAPSVVVMEQDNLVGYALATLQECRKFHPDLEIMLNNLAPLHFIGRPLMQQKIYCMGQICIDQNYRGRGLVSVLYERHREVYSPLYDLILTEISTSNKRSLKAHQNTGFKAIHTYKDSMDEWAVTVWDWS